MPDPGCCRDTTPSLALPLTSEILEVVAKSLEALHLQLASSSARHPSSSVQPEELAEALSAPPPVAPTGQGLLHVGLQPAEPLAHDATQALFSGQHATLLDLPCVCFVECVFSITNRLGGIERRQFVSAADLSGLPSAMIIHHSMCFQDTRTALKPKALPAIAHKQPPGSARVPALVKGPLTHPASQQPAASLDTGHPQLPETATAPMDEPTFDIAEPAGSVDDGSPSYQPGKAAYSGAQARDPQSESHPAAADRLQPPSSSQQPAVPDAAGPPTAQPPAAAVVLPAMQSVQSKPSAMHAVFGSGRGALTAVGIVPPKKAPSAMAGLFKSSVAKAQVNALDCIRKRSHRFLQAKAGVAGPGKVLVPFMRAVPGRWQFGMTEKGMGLLVVSLTLCALLCRIRQQGRRHRGYEPHLQCHSLWSPPASQLCRRIPRHQGPVQGSRRR